MVILYYKTLLWCMKCSSADNVSILKLGFKITWNLYFLFMRYSFVHICIYTWAVVHAHVWTYVWRLEVDIGCCLYLCPPYFSEIGLLDEHRVYCLTMLATQWAQDPPVSTRQHRGYSCTIPCLTCMWLLMLQTQIIMKFNIHFIYWAITPGTLALLN